MNTENRDHSIELREQVSALGDGELAADSRRFLLKRLADDVELKQAWANYHLIGDSLRRQAGPPLSSDFADRIQAAISADASTAGGFGHGLARWVGGGAVAAAVALAAILTVPVQPGPTTVGSGLVEAAPSGLREQDLRPDLSRATHTVAQGSVASYPALQPHSGMPMRFVPVLQPDGRLLLVPYSPLKPNEARGEWLNPPLLPVQPQ